MEVTACGELAGGFHSVAQKFHSIFCACGGLKNSRAAAAATGGGLTGGAGGGGGSSGFVAQMQNGIIDFVEDAAGLFLFSIGGQQWATAKAKIPYEKSLTRIAIFLAGHLSSFHKRLSGLFFQSKLFYD